MILGAVSVSFNTKSDGAPEKKRVWDAQWSNGLRVGCRSERSGFELGS